MWETLANVLYCVYGTQVDWEERFFICPECGEPIYEDDWDASELETCPVCEFVWGE